MLLLQVTTFISGLIGTIGTTSTVASGGGAEAEAEVVGHGSVRSKK